MQMVTRSYSRITGSQSFKILTKQAITKIALAGKPYKEAFVDLKSMLVCNVRCLFSGI